MDAPKTILAAWREARNIDAATIARLVDVSLERYRLLETRAVRADAGEASAIEGLFFAEFPCVLLLADYEDGSKLLAKLDSAFRDAARALIACGIKKRVA